MRTATAAITITGWRPECASAIWRASGPIGHYGVPNRQRANAGLGAVGAEPDEEVGVSMRFFIDTEFIEDGRTIDLLSIGIVAEDGREYYAQVSGVDSRRANDWVKANVLPQLRPCPLGHDPFWHQPHPPVGIAHPCVSECPWKDRGNIRLDLLAFISPDHYGKPEFWGYFADYDWVALCQLFGTMMDLPKGWPMYCRDIKQWCDMLGNPRLPEQGKGEHHALADARWNQTAWEFLQDTYRKQRAAWAAGGYPGIAAESLMP